MTLGNLSQFHLFQTFNNCVPIYLQNQIQEQQQHGNDKKRTGWPDNNWRKNLQLH